MIFLYKTCIALHEPEKWQLDVRFLDVNLQGFVHFLAPKTSALHFLFES